MHNHEVPESLWDFELKHAERFGKLKSNNKISTPLPKDYHPELDTSEFLNDENIEV